MAIILFILVYIAICIGSEFFGEWVAYGRSKKEDTVDRYAVRTRYSFRFRFFSILVSSLTCIVFVISLIFAAINHSLDITALIAMIISALVIISFPLLLTLIIYRTYEVIQEEGILVKRLTKTKLIPYSDMGSYTYTFNQLVVYDHTGRILFDIADNRIGKQAVLEQIVAHNIPIKQNKKHP